MDLQPSFIYLPCLNQERDPSSSNPDTTGPCVWHVSISYLRAFHKTLKARNLFPCADKHCRTTGSGWLKKMDIWLRPPTIRHNVCQTKIYLKWTTACLHLFSLFFFFNFSSFKPTTRKLNMASGNMSMPPGADLTASDWHVAFCRKALYSPRRCWRSRACYCLETCSIWQSWTHLRCSW